MNTVKIRGLELGTGIPAICIPNIGKTKEEILSLAGQYKEMPMDLMEWRVDWFEGVRDLSEVREVLSALRSLLGDTPLLFTFRSLEEGGACALDGAAYTALNQAAADTGMTDLIDVELFRTGVSVPGLIDYIHAAGAKVIVSSHDFEKTPPKSEILCRLRQMQDLGADIPKIAVMPRSRRDVLTLLAATEEMASDYADRPIITMSMSGTGSISRIACEAFGSCLTFGSGSAASAPGQIEAEELRRMLVGVHNALGDGHSPVNP